MKQIFRKATNSSSISSWVLTIIQLSSGVLILPILLGKLSSLEISTWLLLNTVSAIGGLAQVGFGNSTLRALSYYIKGANSIPKNLTDFNTHTTDDGINVQGIYKVLGTTTRIFNILQIISFILVSSFGIAILWNVLSQSNHSIVLWLALLFVILTCSIAIQTVKLMCVIQSLNEISRFNNIKTIVAIGRVILLFVFSIFYPSILVLVSIGLIEVIIDYFIATKLAQGCLNKAIVDYDPSQSLYDKNTFDALWPSSWKLGVIQIGSYLINNASSIVVAQVKDINLVAAFLVTKKILDIVRAVAQIPFFSNIQKVYEGIVAKSNFTKPLIAQYISILTYLFLFSTAFLMIFGSLALNTLHIHSKLLSPSLLFLMALTLFLEAHHSIHATIYLATSDVPFIKGALISGGLLLALDFTCLNFGGVTAIILIQFFVQLAYNNWYPVYLSLKMCRWHLIDYVGDVLIWPFRYMSEHYASSQLSK